MQPPLSTAFLVLLLPVLQSATFADDGAKPAKEPATLASPALQLAWRGPEGKLEVYNNSETYSTAISINASGAILGVREVAQKGGMVLSPQNFYSDGKQSIDLPKLAAFSNLNMAALSDDGKAVGFASRPPGDPNGSLIGVLWDVKTGETIAIPPIEGEIVSHAMDISAAGDMIVGYSTGAEPPRIRPCYWIYDTAMEQWTATALKTEFLSNPFIVTGGIRIASDGKTIVACVTEKTDGTRYDNHILRWRQKGDTWEATQISDVSARIGDVSNDGHVAINMPVGGLVKPFVIRKIGEVLEVPLLKGDPQGEASFMDQEGIVYGGSDDPPGPEGGPTAFRFEGKTTTTPAWAAKAFYSTITGGNARGQLIGNIDVVIKGGSPRLMGPDDELPNDDASGGAEVEVKTLAFRWTPAKPKKIAQ